MPIVKRPCAECNGKGYHEYDVKCTCGAEEKGLEEARHNHESYNPITKEGACSWTKFNHDPSCPAYERITVKW